MLNIQCSDNYNLIQLLITIAACRALSQMLNRQIMKKSNVFFLTGLIGVTGILLGAWKKITHQVNADLYLTIGLTFFAIFWIMTLWDVLNRSYENRVHRIWWLLVVLLFPLIGSLVYHSFNRRSL